MHIYKASSRHLFKDYIGVNDNQENVLKVIKATKLLNEEINKANNKLGKYSEAKDESRDKEHIVILKNANDINSLINHQEKPDVKRISVLKIHSSNFSKFIDNYGIIKRLFEKENKSIQFIAR